MPWWSWIVIWIALVALSLLFFVVLGIRLFRQFMTTARELGEAAERFSRFPSAPADSDAADPPGVSPGGLDSGGLDPGAASGGRPFPGSAVFASPTRMRQDYRAAKISRQGARRLRRVQRKTDRGQPQSLRDIDFS
jgi:hypothetical protein